ncbi:MAG TPA: adenylate/guanylate cyclase domain-containing protein, partial [Chloroflexota bacterium]|nr:adenylate/guanylate cyclase domain-containing protein [Chloroflexota bacterium]
MAVANAPALTAPGSDGAPGLLRAPESTIAPGVPAALPTGILTFLMTDVEGSTALWEDNPEAMRTALARHDALLDEALDQYGGRQIKERGEGDSIFAVFRQASSAVAAACAIQQALQAEPWPTGAPLRVRIGLHTGEAELRDIGYYGPVVNCTARLRSLGHGGQILLSQVTAQLVSAALPDGITLRPMGHHTLKGLRQPVDVFQVLHPALPAEFPPLASPQAPRHNLPETLSSFIGRELEQQEVSALLSRPPARHRLVTLTGTGGTGKTRLALAVASTVVDTFEDGVWLVELATLTDPALVPQAVANALGQREEPGRSVLATVIDYLKSRRLLLVLDNCEHLVAACAEVASALLHACAQLHILATSREALDVAGEHRYRVPSLAVPDLGHYLPTPAVMRRYEAVQLFEERARSRRRDFSVTGTNMRAVAQICARLDGIPLAIELAAARVGALPVEGIAARLDDCFRLLTGGPRTVLPRQQTLRASLDWSFDLLSEPERALLRRLSTFAGGCTLAAAEAICAGTGVEEWDVLDLLDQLVNKSLVVLDELPEHGDEPRYRLLETVRHYGQEKLAATPMGEVPERVVVGDRHLGWYLALAEQAEPALVGPEQALWLARLEAEHDNLRAALRHALEHGQREPGLRLAGALWRFWYTRGHLSEGRGWLDELLADGAGAASLRARALRGAGVLAYNQGDFARAVALTEQSLALYEQLGERQGVAATLNLLGYVAVKQGDGARACTLSEASLAL